MGISWTVLVVTCIMVVLTCFVMCGCVRLCNVWVCACVGFVMCVSFGNVCTFIYCVLYCLYCVFCIVAFMYMFSYLFCLYCHRVTTQLQLIIIIIIITIIMRCLSEFVKPRKTTIRFGTSVRLSAGNDSAPTGRIFMKFGIRGFLENLWRKSNFH
jgi:hypothetical protein